MPAIMGNGIQVNATRAEANENVVAVQAPENEEELLMVAVTPEGIQVNGEATELAVLSDRIHESSSPVPTRRRHRAQRFVYLEDVVNVMDAAKAGGAQSLALLNRKEDAS